MSNKISLIIQREYNQRVRKKSFIVTTIVMPLLMVGLMVIPALMSHYGGDEQRTVVVIDQSGKVGSKLENSEATKFETTDQPYEAAEKSMPEAYGFLVIGSDIVENPSSVKLYTRASSTIAIERDLTRQLSSIIENERIANTQIAGLDSIMQSVRAKVTLPTFTIGKEVKAEKSSSSTLSMILGYLGGFMIYMFVFMYGGFVMHGVIEEKNSRIVEVIVSSVKPFQLMMGKILGIGLVALTQIVIWVVLFVALSAAASGLLMSGADAGGAADLATAASSQGVNTNVASMLGILSNPGYIVSILIYYVLFFVGGYLLYAAMFAAVGSAVDNAQDAQQLQLPITIPLILAIMVLINAMQSPNSGVAFWFSIIPFTSPIVMMARIPYGVPLWEIITSLVLLYSTFIGMTWVSAKIYRVGIFMYGKKPSLKELVKWARYKN